MRRTRGTGSIYVKHDAYYARWRTPDGRRLNRRLGPVRPRGTRDGITKAQAEAKLRELIGDESVVARTSVTVAELGEQLARQLELKGRKRATVEAVRSHIRTHLDPHFGRTPVDRIDERDVERFALALLREGRKVKSIRNYTGTLHSIFELARRRRIVRENPVSLADLPAVPAGEAEIRFLDREELEALLRAAPPDPGPVDEDWWPLEHVLYLTAALTGLRQGELRGLRWRDVDWVAGKVRVRRSYVRGEFTTPKSRRSVRAVPMHDRVAAALARHHQATPWQHDDDLVFAHPHTGHPLDGSKVLKRFKAACGRAGLRPMRFHDLRHTFGTRMAAAGAPVRSIQEWMGHRDYKTTLIYADYAPSPHERAWFDEAFGGGEGRGVGGGEAGVLGRGRGPAEWQAGAAERHG